MDPGSLRVGEPSGTDRVGELVHRRPHHLVPRRVPAPKQAERALGVQVARVLRLDREDQLVERVRGPRREQVAEVALEPPDDRLDARPSGVTTRWRGCGTA